MTVSEKKLFTLSEIKRTLCIDKGFITKVIHELPGYFSEYSQPPKGIERLFTMSDISTLAYLSFCWEDNVDYECLKISLNRGEQFEFPFQEYWFDLIPIIRDDIENIESESSNYVFFNRAIFQSNFELAAQYLDSARVLIKEAQNHSEPWLRLFPILFNLRHSIELFFKGVIKKDMSYTHDIDVIYKQFKLEKNLIISTQFKNFIYVLHEYDIKSTTFRYANNEGYEELVFDLNHTLLMMDRFERMMGYVHFLDKK